MDNPWWKRRKKKSPWFNDIYEELEKLGYLIDETIQKASEGYSDKSPSRHRVQGFSIKIGPDGKPKIYKFSSRQSRQIEEDEIGDDPEPLVDMIEDEEMLVVLAALPGVRKEDIDLRVTETCLTVSVDADEFEWYNEFKLPTKVNPNSAHASYKNGVLEVKMERLDKLVRNDKISVKK